MEIWDIAIAHSTQSVKQTWQNLLGRGEGSSLSELGLWVCSPLSHPLSHTHTQIIFCKTVYVCVCVWVSFHSDNRQLTSRKRKKGKERGREGRYPWINHNQTWSVLTCCIVSWKCEQLKNAASITEMVSSSQTGQSLLQSETDFSVEPATHHWAALAPAPTQLRQISLAWRKKWHVVCVCVKS